MYNSSNMENFTSMIYQVRSGQHFLSLRLQMFSKRKKKQSKKHVHVYGKSPSTRWNTEVAAMTNLKRLDQSKHKANGRIYLYDW